MDSILFNPESFEEQIQKLNIEYECLQDIYNQFLRQVVTRSDKIGEFRIKANEIKEEILRIEEKILSLKLRAEEIRNQYMGVEEINLRLVNDLPKAQDVLEGDAAKEAAVGRININRNYRVVSTNSPYVINRNYDFEDWLVDWLNASGNR